MGQKRRVPINEVGKVTFLFGCHFDSWAMEHGLA